MKIHPAWCVEDRFEPGVGGGDSHLSAEIILPQTRDTEMTVRLALATAVNSPDDGTLEPQIVIAGVSDRAPVFLRLDMVSAQDLLSALPKLLLAAVHPDLGARGLNAMADVTAERNTLLGFGPFDVPPLPPERNTFDETASAVAQPRCDVYGRDSADVAFDEAREMDRVGFYSPGGVFRYVNAYGHGSKIMVSGLCHVITATWPGPLEDEYRLMKSTESRILRKFIRLDEARAYYVQLRDALPLCGFDVDGAVFALAALADVADADRIKSRVTATCSWSESVDPHVADYVTEAGATCFDCAIAYLKAGGLVPGGLPPLPDIHALKILRTAERAALAAAGV